MQGSAIHIFLVTFESEFLIQICALMMTAEGRKSPVHVHVDRETPVHVHLKKKKKGKPGVPTAVEVCSNSVFFRIPKKM